MLNITPPTYLAFTEHKLENLKNSCASCTYAEATRTLAQYNGCEPLSATTAI